MNPNDNPIFIRKATPEDAAELVLLNQAFNGASEPDVFLAKQLADPGQVEFAILAEFEGKVVGFACLRICPCILYTSPSAELTELYVIPEQRRKGIARRLVDFAVRMATQVGADELVVLTDKVNAIARHFYWSNFFEEGDLALRRSLKLTDHIEKIEALLTDALQIEFPDQIETERLFLRSFREGDGAMYAEVSQRNKEHLRKYESGNSLMKINSPEEAEVVVREMAAAWRNRSFFLFAVFEKQSGEFTGQVYLGPLDWEAPDFEIGYIADADHEGRGFVSEACRAVISFCFKDLKAHRLSIHCDETNLRSQHVAERCGFTREGLVREDRRHPDGSFSSTVIYGLLKSEFEKKEK